MICARTSANAGTISLVKKTRSFVLIVADSADGSSSVNSTEWPNARESHESAMHKGKGCFRLRKHALDWFATPEGGSWGESVV
jgi:hypothetical protein